MWEEQTKRRNRPLQTISANFFRPTNTPIFCYERRGRILRSVGVRRAMYSVTCMLCVIPNVNGVEAVLTVNRFPIWNCRVHTSVAGTAHETFCVCSENFMFAALKHFCDSRTSMSIVSVDSSVSGEPECLPIFSCEKLCCQAGNEYH